MTTTTAAAAEAGPAVRREEISRAEVAKPTILRAAMPRGVTRANAARGVIFILISCLETIKRWNSWIAPTKIRGIWRVEEGGFLVRGRTKDPTTGKAKEVRKVLLSSQREPFMTTLYSTPRVALIPLVLIWFGIGMWSKVFIVFINAVFPVLINTIGGVRAIDHDLLKAARAYCASDWQIFTSVVIPGSVPFIHTGVRQARTDLRLGARHVWADALCQRP